MPELILHPIKKPDGIERVPPPNLLSRAKGRNVKITLLDGTELTGVIDGYTQYEIRLKNDKRDLLVFKHAIKMIEGDFSRADKNITKEEKK